ncbi:MAG TPA: UDP-N-acetylmuramoyl-L-alanine--D-glutamate ligase, partial [Myxococcota bacterium]|nr:UDP-N-acetylmuramoyl-L-alanine--D-glutamate ligase [Myxococcota bacterium]
MELQGQHVVVVGMARSGVAAATLALAKGATVHCVDQNPAAPAVAGCSLHYGSDPIGSLLMKADRVVVSPGVPARHPDIAAAIAAGVRVEGELAFAASFLSFPLLAVSGTNGKSTTTYLLGQILEQAGFRPFVGGNLGIPLSEAALHPDNYNIGAVEVSSYMMELPGGFHPHAAAILNLSPDHLERHGDLDNYGAHKCRMFAQMGPADAQILPIHDARLLRLAEGSPGTRLYLGAWPGLRAEGNQVELVGTPDPGPIDVSEFQLPGLHNRENLSAAILLAAWAGMKRSSLRVGALRGLAHRLERIERPGNIHWYNDSKATNVDSTRVALEAMTRPSIVLLGGRGKAGADYQSLLPLLQDHQVLCFGEEGPRIAAALGSPALGSPITGSPALCGSLAEAVALAAQLAQPGSAVLL